MAGTVVTAAVNNINIVNGTASLDVAAASAVDVNANLTVNNATTLTGSPYTPGGTDVVVADGGLGVSTLTDHGVLVGSGTDPITALAVGTNGQVLVGSTGLDPVFATITDGEGIDTTLGAGTLTIAAETASETNPGVIEIATDAETIAGSDTARGITASNLKAKLGTQTDGGLLVGAGQTAAVEALAVGLTTQVLVGGGAGTNPAWGTDIPTGVTIGAAYIYRAAGTDIPVTDGGTGVSTLTTAYGLLAAGTTATGTVQTLAAGTSGYLLQSGGAAALPSWTNTPALGTPSSGDLRNCTFGAWTAPAFDAGNFTASGSMTWTVAAGDVILFKYIIMGKTMIIAFEVVTSTVGGTLNSKLQINIPASKTATNVIYTACHIYDDGTPGNGYCYVDGTILYIRKTDDSNWLASTDNTRVQGQITFEIN